MLSARTSALAALSMLVLSVGHPVRADVSFERDVMAVLSKAGCNRGVCHGNKNGKGGLLLSLRGEDPDADYSRLVRQEGARRLDFWQPERSLALLKATGQVPHGGGQRFAVGSWEHEALRRWIEEGLRRDAADAPRLERLEVEPRERTLVDPEDRVQITARAVFSDGSRRDVSSIACYEASSPIVEVSPGGLIERSGFGETTVLVRYLDRQLPVRLAFVPARPEFVWSSPAPRDPIDELVFDKLRRLRMSPSEICDDSVFLRRIWLDLTGRLPPGDRARAFVADPSHDKRERVVDELLRSEGFAELWALKWADLLRAEEKSLDRKGVQTFHRWIRQSFRDGKPLDVFVRELLTGTGSTYENPPANFYRSLRDPVTRAESAAQLFLGTRLRCAKCHNHPFDTWTQTDYWSWAGVFSRVRYKIVENRRRDGLDQHEFVGEQIVWSDRSGALEDPRTGTPVSPRFLGSERRPSDEELLEELAEWVTAASNPFFARAQANRIWFHLLGRGIVEPVDDFRATNPPSHPELLEELAESLVRSGYDVRALVRRIVLSATYQLSSEPNDTNADDETNYSRGLVRRLAAEQLLDAFSTTLDAPLRFVGYPEGLSARALPGVRAVRSRDGRPTSADVFLSIFGKPERLLTCECERSTDTTLSQAFQIVSGPLVHELLAHPGGRVARWAEEATSAERVVDELWWAALSRAATLEERRAMVEWIEAAPTDERRAAIEDVVWSVLGSKEFVLRR